MSIKNLKSSLNSTEIVDQIASSVDAFLGTHTVTTLGPLYSLMPYATAEKELQLYRAKKNWEKPSEDASSERRVKSVAQMLASDALGMTDFDPNLIQDDFLKYQLQNARLRLQKNLIKHYRFKPIRVRMPSGETFVSAKGDVSLVAKLRDVEQWTVTTGCFDLAAEVLYNIPALKKSARHHIGKVPKETNELLWSVFKDYDNPGFEIFKCLLLDVVTFVDGMRITTVPKNNETDRVIGCEPFLNMLAQSVVEEGIRSVIKTQYKIDLRTSADVHKALISDPRNSTIDFKNASNSNYLAFAKWFLRDTPLLQHILDTRSEYAVVDGENHLLNMVSPMGGGFTFGLMTLILLSIAREYDTFAHVYGDDLIVDQDTAESLIQLYRFIGYETNTSKTFLEGNFRESCGAFICEGEYITSFEMEWPTDLIAAVVLTNKIGILAQKDGSIWGRLHDTLLNLWHPSFYNWFPSVEYVAARGRFNQLIVHTQNVAVYTKGRMKRKRECKKTRLLWEHNVTRNRRFLKQIQVEPNQMQFVWKLQYREKEYRFTPVDNVHHQWYGYYMFGGRCSTPIIRYNEDRDGPRQVVFEAELVPFWSHSLPETRNVPGQRWIHDLLNHIYV